MFPHKRAVALSMLVFLNRGPFTKDSSSGVATTRLKATSCQMALHAKRHTADNSNFHMWLILHVKMANGVHFQTVSRAVPRPRALLVSTRWRRAYSKPLMHCSREFFFLKNYLQVTSLFNAERISVREPAEIRDGTMTKMEIHSTHLDKDAVKSCAQVPSASKKPHFQKN